MRFRSTLAGLLVSLAAVAQADAPPDLAIHGKSVAAVPMSGYELKSYVFPSGTIKLLTFKAGSAATHSITDETQFFVVTGEVETVVDGKSVSVSAGDAAYRPAGQIRATGAKEAVVVAHVVGSSNADAKPTVVRGEGLSEALSAQWTENGTAHRVTTPEEIAKAPAAAGKLAVKRYDFGGNSIRLVKLSGGATNPSAYTSDNILFVINGRLRRHEDGKTFEVVAGDAVREISGARGYWEILEDAAFLSTSAFPLKPAS
jgi:mannose-6-phosphate isomerase-like protein (cupin superfamily)